VIFFISSYHQWEDGWRR